MNIKIASKRIFNRYEWYFLSFILLLALSTHLYSSWGGLIWTIDSNTYWTASRNIINEGKLTAADGGAYVFWPPLFPITLSLFSESSYYVFHSFSFLLGLFFIYRFLKLKYSITLSLMVLSVYTLTVYPYLLSSFLWTEVNFILFLYSGLYFFQKWNMDENNHKYLMLAGILFCLMCLQRNAGVFIMVGLSIYSIVLYFKNKDFKKLFSTGSALSISVIPVILWNINRRILFPEEYYIYQQPFLADFLKNFKMVSNELIRLVLPTDTGLNSYIIIILLSIIMMSIIYKKENSLIITLITTYIFLFITLPLLEKSEIGRFLAPIIPLIILQTISSSKYYIIKLDNNKIKNALILFFSIVLLYNIVRTVNNVEQWNYRSVHNPKSAKIFF
ncbi:hypothetical protein QYS48_25710 [Marivirga arenosa]|uniref:Uncharacterized protein n=1 Tax=Marivirga arenosa TaxID=3059076 RepID=A0AA49JA84_9BACT|nr:hypothetical protein [Marivirga sp. ABR2-2]WKK85307.1 hypothetical protein QYS48_25710 [Marivirga sp. ABR2-2]